MKRHFAVAFCLVVLSTAAVRAETIDVKVKGMVCSFCAQGLTKQFKEQAAVESVKVTLKDQKLSVHLKDGAQLNDQEVKKVIEDSGYTVESIQRK